MVTRTVLISALAGYAAAHGTIQSVKGSNGVLMPGLTVADGTFRTVQQNLFGQFDTSLMDDGLGNGPLGINSVGVVDPATNFLIFMGEKKAPKIAPPLIPLEGERERLVTETAGKGAQSGLPTPDNNGIIAMTWLQINVDGAGPMTAQLDTTSAGTKLDAFQTIDVIKDVPGENGESDAILTSHQMSVQIPRGTQCQGKIGKTSNVCIIRVFNPTGPWGGAIAFTTAGGANKRSIEDRISRSRIARALHLTA